MKNIFPLFPGAAVLFIVLIFNSGIHAQQKSGVGIALGGGTIQGNIPSQGSFSGALFIDFYVPFIPEFSSRATFIYVTDVNILLPSNSSRYNPFLKGFSLKEIYTSTLSGNVFFEAGIGPLFINDRTYTNLNKWDSGLAFSLLTGMDFTSDGKSGIITGIGAEYGLTFTNTSVQYLSVYLQLKYQF